MSQEKMIVEYLKQGKKLTRLDALHLFGCLSLNSRVSDLNNHKGYGIKSEMVKRNGKMVAEYSLDTGVRQ